MWRLPNESIMERKRALLMEDWIPMIHLRNVENVETELAHKTATEMTNHLREACQEHSAQVV